MQKGLLVVVLSILAMPLAYAADNGLITLKSPYSVEQTLDRFEQALKS